jgi:hypothetical protein
MLCPKQSELLPYLPCPIYSKSNALNNCFFGVIYSFATKGRRMLSFATSSKGCSVLPLNRALVLWRGQTAKFGLIPSSGVSERVGPDLTCGTGQLSDRVGPELTGGTGQVCQIDTLTGRAWLTASPCSGDTLTPAPATTYVAALSSDAPSLDATYSAAPSSDAICSAAIVLRRHRWGGSTCSQAPWVSRNRVG